LAEARLAEFYLQAGDFPGAFRWYARALERQPDDKLLRTRQAQMLAVLQRSDQARQVLRSVVDKEDYVPALISLAQLEEAAGGFESSAELLERVLAQDPDNVVANNNLAMLLVQLEKAPERALELAERARRLDSNKPEILSTYACALVHSGNYTAAVETLRPRVRAEPNEPWLRYCYGVALVNVGQAAAAKEQFAACLLLDGDFPRKEQMAALAGKP
jgi:predicted Zn-dependent protease